jgi:hypothetical protein
MNIISNCDPFGFEETHPPEPKQRFCNECLRLGAHAIGCPNDAYETGEDDE